MAAQPILQVENLHTQFSTETGTVRSVDGVSFTLHAGETLGIVGESGSGKTVTSLSVMGLIENPGRIADGKVRYLDQELQDKPRAEMDRLRGREISMVFQDSLSSLNPTMKVGRQIGRVLRDHTDLSARQRKARVVELLREMNIPEPAKRAQSYPHEMSGGMRQRVLIAMAIACNPKVLILDEPTTALDVTIEAQIFELVERLQRDHQMGTILITHDLSVVAHACDRVLIMYAGRVVEEAPAETLYANPLHPYTLGLLQSIPSTDHPPRTHLPSIPGEVPDLARLPRGCSFAPRCRFATETCRREDPALRGFGRDHRAACIRVEEIHDHVRTDQVAGGRAAG
jgi:oligopeptide/dipeptide ABC transporter ATP-binding protein